MRGLPTLPPSLPPSQFTDDVLSHLFLSTPYCPISESEKSTATSSAADPMTVHLLPNPSHLETVTPVALGFARGLQVPLGSLKAEAKSGKESYELGTKVLSLAIHGDAAFGGQGVVAETFNLASLPHFNAGGTIHLVVNNQLGYTTPVRLAIRPLVQTSPVIVPLTLPRNRLCKVARRSTRPIWPRWSRRRSCTSTATRSTTSVAR